jgi:hypothetical protein
MPAFTALLLTTVWARTSAPARLTVVVSAPIMVTSPEAQVVVRGQTLRLSAESHRQSAVRYQWRCNGTDIVGATNSTLTLANLQFHEAGNYQMVAFNSVGSTTSLTAAVTVTPLVAWGTNDVGQCNIPLA